MTNSKHCVLGLGADDSRSIVLGVRDGSEIKILAERSTPAVGAVIGGVGDA